MKRNKSKEIIILIMGCFLCCVAMGVFGCGSRTCQKPSCTSTGGKNTLTVPGCGGCFTSGNGCNSGLWSQAFSCVTFRNGCSGCGIGCANKYHGSNKCIGCGSAVKSDYMGIKFGFRQVACGVGFGFTGCDGCVIGYDRYEGCGGASLNEFNVKG